MEYGLLICIGSECRCALSPASTLEHLRRNHRVPVELRQQMDQYTKGFPFKYDYSSVPLPRDGLAPQPIIAVVEVIQCKHCVPFRSQGRKAMKVHGNMDHSNKRVPDEELCYAIRAQSWF